MNAGKKGDRKQQILEVLALQLETHEQKRVTTASLARAVQVSEAALYRHFANKGKMFEALIDFAENTIFRLINTILDSEESAIIRCEKIVYTLLVFIERNPGISRVLAGDALVGEDYQLYRRVAKIFDRLETQFKQVLRESQLADQPRPIVSAEVGANHLLVMVEGKMHQFIRSSFRQLPSKYYEQQWQALQRGIFG